jgi:hypothetical protein
MVSAYRDQIGYHRPAVLAASAGFSRNGITYTSTLHNQTWPTANRALLVRVRNPRPFQPTHAFFHNDGTVSGNLDIGIYEEIGGGELALLASTGANSQSGTSQLQFIALASAPVLPAGWLVLAASLSTTAGTYASRDIGPVSYGMERLFGTAQADSAHPLPATLTPVTGAFVDIPNFGVVERLF